MEFEGKWLVLYEKCLNQLRSRTDFNEECEEMLCDYVFLTKRIAELRNEMSDAAPTVKHTNKADRTNDVSNPLVRVFVILNKERLALAKELQLTPASTKGVKKVEAEQPKGVERFLKKA